MIDHSQTVLQQTLRLGIVIHYTAGSSVKVCSSQPIQDIFGIAQSRLVIELQEQASTVRKYTRAKKLSERMLNELIERIEVHQSEKIGGIHRQRLTIRYNCVGALEIPETLTMPEISMQTRKGVTVSYDPLRSAM